jgi:hypothetical protein
LKAGREAMYTNHISLMALLLFHQAIEPTQCKEPILLDILLRDER